jgi:hypothetical protein
MQGSCEHDDEPSGYTKDGAFLLSVGLLRDFDKGL